MSRVSTIIPTTRGGFSHLAQLLPGLAKEIDNELIIVDNCSRDGTTHFLANYKLIVKINDQNEGFAKANNQGAKLASGEYLLFLNNDTIVTPGFLNRMIETFMLDEKIAVVGCQIVKMHTSQVQHAGVCFTTDYIPYELGLDLNGIAHPLAPNDPRILSIREVPSVTAACMMVKKSVFDEVGGFDEGYINGWEDTDLVLKIKEKGYKAWYNGHAKISHLHFGSKDQGRFQYETQNRARYDEIWVHTKRAENVLKGFREG